jgi:phosphatidate cytidylyltransferase
MLSLRIISAAIGILLFVLFIFWGSFPFFLFILMITALGVMEYSAIFQVNNRNNRFFLLSFSLITVIYTYLTNKGITDFSCGLLFFIFILTSFLWQISNNYQDIVRIMGINLFGIIYIGGGMSFIMLLRDFPLQPEALWLLLLATWATDTGAFFFGRFLGRNKLAARISPNKTVEGALGGILLSILITCLYTTYIGIYAFPWLLYGLLVSVIAIIGDLFESAIKREAGVKDSGRIIPGHGGILDRFDSLLLAAPFTYYYLLWIIK